MEPKPLRRAALGLVVLVAVLAAAPADAHRKSFPTRITIEQTLPLTFEGEVRSSRAGCVRRRELQLWQVGLLGGESKVGDPFRADAQGAWSASEILRQARGPIAVEHFVTAKPKVIRRGNGHRHSCAAGRSPNV